MTGQLPADGAGPIFTPAQAAEFRAAGRWMAVVGWVQVAAGAVLAAVLGAGWTGLAPGAARDLLPTPREMGAAGLEVIATLAVGAYTLRAGAGFRRVFTAPGAAAAAEAAARLRHLFAAQAGLLALLALVYLAGAVVGRA